MLMKGAGASTDLCQSHYNNDDGYNDLLYLSTYLGKLCGVTMVSRSYTVVWFFFAFMNICDTEKAVSSLGQRLALESMVEHNIW